MFSIEACLSEGLAPEVHTRPSTGAAGNANETKLLLCKTHSRAMKLTSHGRPVPRDITIWHPPLTTHFGLPEQIDLCASIPEKE